MQGQISISKLWGFLCSHGYFPLHATICFLKFSMQYLCMCVSRISKNLFFSLKILQLKEKIQFHILLLKNNVNAFMSKYKMKFGNNERCIKELQQSIDLCGSSFSFKRLGDTYRSQAKIWPEIAHHPWKRHPPSMESKNAFSFAWYKDASVYHDKDLQKPQKQAKQLACTETTKVQGEEVMRSKQK